jgi:microsomal dipeptidase-like Zn-dependent dipeptidase
MNLEALPQVAEELFKRGMKEQEIRGIFGANFLNLAKNVWKAPRL